MGSPQERDISRLNWLLKEKSYAQMDITCVTPSRWAQEEIRKSALLGNRDIVHIPNCVPLGIFTPDGSIGLREQLGIAPESNVLLIGAASLHNPRKGLRYILDALQQLYEGGIRNFTLVSFGACTPQIAVPLPFTWHVLPHLSSEAAIAEAMRMADGFLLTSEEENFPSVALECLATGTPVIGFSSGGIPEIVEDGISGFIGPTGDVPALMENICQLLRLDRERRAAMRQACRARAEQYSEQRCAHAYTNLFQKILRGKRSTKTVPTTSQSINLLCYEDTSSWILGKFARKLNEHLTTLGQSCQISREPGHAALIAHHIIYLGWVKSDPGIVRTLMITHIDSAEKIQLLHKQLSVCDMGICMSADTVRRLQQLGLPSGKLCYVHPAQDGNVCRRKICLGVTSRLYKDARKRETMLVDALKMFSPEIFFVKIMGSGWESQVQALREYGIDVEYVPDFEASTYRHFFEHMYYYIYLGMDEGSMGFLDALYAGVKTIVTAQGYHLEFPNAPTYHFTTIEDLRAILASLQQEQIQRRSNIEEYTWERYAKQHVIIWKYLLDRRNGNFMYMAHNALNDITLPARRARTAVSRGNVNPQLLLTCVDVLHKKYPKVACHILRQYLVACPDALDQLQRYEDIDGSPYTIK